jgi:hypothetical protein
MKKAILLIVTSTICLVSRAFTQEDDSTSLLTFETPGSHMIAVYEKIEEQWLFLIGAPAEGIKIANGMHEYRFGTESLWGKFTVDANGQPQTWRLSPGRPEGVADGVLIIAASALTCVLSTVVVNTLPQGLDFISYLLDFSIKITAVTAVGGGVVGCLVGVIWVTLSLPYATRVE